MTTIETDNAAPHQIRLTFDRRQRVEVSCTCRRTLPEREPSAKQRKAGLPSGGRADYESFGLPASTREAKALYNDLSNHDQSQAPFTSEHLLEER